jgi:hypothetical protein
MCKRIGLFIIILIFSSSFACINASDIEYDDALNLEIKIENNDAPNDADPGSKTRNSCRSEKISVWTDDFLDASKTSDLNDVVLEDGSAELDDTSGNYPTQGSITSKKITPSSKAIWGNFYANTTGSMFRREIIIDNTANTNTLGGYVINFSLDTRALINAGKMRADCGDIRFYDADKNELSYWIDSGINTIRTKIWVKMNSIPSSSKTTINMTYGTPWKQSQSSGTNTFEYFDDFEGASGYDTAYWTAVGGDAANVFSSSTEEVYENTKSLKADFTTTYDNAYLRHDYGSTILNKTIAIRMHDNMSDSSVWCCDFELWGSTTWARTLTTNIDYRYNYYKIGTLEGVFMKRGTSWHEIEMDVAGGYSEFCFDGKRTGTKSQSNYYRVIIAGQFNYGNDFTHYYDTYFVRPFTNPKPTVNLGNEYNHFDDNIQVSFKIINADDNLVIATVVDGQDISSITAQDIKLRGEFTSNSYGTAKLHDWGVTWNTIPIIEDIRISPSYVYRYDSIKILLNVSDVEEPDSDLNLSAEYKSPYDLSWQTEYLSKPYYEFGHWEFVFSPPLSAKTGLYKFRFNCLDSLFAPYSYPDPIYIEVRNNKPSQPYVTITPAEPSTLDELMVGTTSKYDSETSEDELEIWYHWYKNNNFIIAHENQTKIPNTATEKGEIWRCDVYVYDGEDIGSKGSAEVTICNTPPVVENPMGILTIKEDEIDSSSIILLNVFSDIDGDELFCSCTGLNIIKVTIDSKTGNVIFEPPHNWYGTEEILFTANDTEAEVSDTLKIEVEPQNDPPRLIKAGAIEVKSTTQVLEFSVNEGSWMNLTFFSEDIDGDSVSYSTNRTDNKDGDDIDNINLQENIMSFLPDSNDIGSIAVNLTITDSNGTYVYYEMMVHVKNVNDPPEVEITLPLDGIHFNEGQLLEFECSYSDKDSSVKNYDEVLYFTWYKNEVTEPLGEGEYLSALKGITLEPGTHKITVRVEDKLGIQAEDSITIVIDKKDEKPNGNGDSDKTDSSASNMSDLSSNPIGIFLLLIIIIIIIVIVLFIVKRKKDVKTEPVQIAPPGVYDGLQSSYATTPDIAIPSTITIEQVPEPPVYPQMPVYGDIPIQSEPVSPEAQEQYMYGESDEYPVPGDVPESSDLPPQPQLPQTTASEHSDQSEVDSLFDLGDEDISEPLRDSAGEDPEYSIDDNAVIHDEETKMWRPDNGKELGGGEAVTEQNELISGHVEKLRTLKEKGLLTENEFEEKKKELLEHIKK